MEGNLTINIYLFCFNEIFIHYLPYLLCIDLQTLDLGETGIT